MKKGLKILFIAVGSIVTIILIVVIWFSIRYSTLTGRMSPAETYAINDTVFSVNDRFVNAFLFKCNNGYFMIDACMSEKNVEVALQELGITANEVKALLLTHSDGDHIGAVGLFPDAEVFLHKDEEQMINGQTAKMGPIKYKWKFGKYTLVESNEVLNIGGLNIDVIHTPGHTPGSVCYMVNGDYLVSGDNLIYSNRTYNQFLEVVNMDTETQIESLSHLPDPSTYKYILTAHHGVHKIE